MGTSSLICVFYRGRFVVAQNSRWNGHPQGQGLKIFKFLLVPANIERLKEGLEHIYTPTQDVLEQIEREMDEPRRISVHFDGPWLSLSQGTGAVILEIVARATAEKPVPIAMDLEFATDYFCEWAYVVDLDCGVFEVFEGGEHSTDDAAVTRFNDVKGEGGRFPSLIKSFSITELPTTEEEFLTIMSIVLTEIEEGRREKQRMEIRERIQLMAMRAAEFSSSTPPWMTDMCERIKDSELGLLGVFPRELRDIIYGYALSIDPFSHEKAKTGFGLLRSSTRICKEAIPLLYQSRLLGITFEPTENCMFKYRFLKWGDTEFSSGQRSSDRSRCIKCLPANFFRLVQNLQICFTGQDDDYPYYDLYLEEGMLLLCNILRDSTQLRYLDISIHFQCNSENITRMARLIEPIKMLRGIRDPNVTVYGFQRYRNDEPRWDLTEEYADYLRQLLMSPHGTPGTSDDGIEVFEDFFTSPDLATDSIDLDEVNDLSVGPEVEEGMIAEYLQDVYNTKDRAALQGSLTGDPEWSTWTSFLEELRTDNEREPQSLLA